MKLKQLREHFQNESTSSTLVWIPKRPFRTEKEAVVAGYTLDKWFIYACGFCGKYHTSKRNKG